MKFSCAWRKTLLRACVINALTCALFPIHSNATEKYKDVSKMIGDMRGSIASAKVVVIREGILFPYNINDKELNRIGCSYLVTSKDDLDSLLNIVTGARIVEVTPFFNGRKMGISANLGIYLTANDGTTTALIFTAGTDLPRAEYGWLNDDTSVRAMNERFAFELREWATERTPVPTLLCDRHKPRKPVLQSE